MKRFNDSINQNDASHTALGNGGQTPFRGAFKRRVQHTVTAFFISLSLVTAAQADHVSNDEPHDTGWSIQVDNDLFAGGQRDQDYTGGFAVTHSGKRVTQYRYTPHGARTALDRLIGLSHFLGGEEHHSVHALEWGAALFTPSDISRRSVNPLDRPYASLFFLNSTEQTILPRRKMSVKSGLTIGILGLDLAGSIQREIHGALGNQRPEGWQHQISSGGELTAKYSVSAQRAAYQRVYSNGLAQELNLTGKVDVGFTTGLGVGFNWRFGRINTPWWSFNPHQSDYFNLGANTASGTRNSYQVKERYIYLGSTVNYTAYNALVQGQFRNSAHTVDRSNVVAGSTEFWGGVSMDIGDQLRADIFVRYRTRDVELPESEQLSWGGFTLSKSF